MNTSAKAFLIDWKASLPKLRAGAPDVARAFGGLHVAVMKDGKLAAREKELIAMAVGLAQGCTECVYLHTEGALKAGATGYITKDSDLEVLLPAIRQVCNGKTFITPGMAEQIVLQEISGVQQAPHKLLTERELQVLELLVSGRTVLEIAADLAISNKTVSTHKARAMEKMAITNTADLMRYALQHGMGGTALASASQSAHE